MVEVNRSESEPCPLQLGANCSFPARKQKKSEVTSRQLGLLRLLLTVFPWLLLQNTLYPIRIFGHVGIDSRFSGHSALGESVADHPLGHPSRVLPIEVHQRSSGIPRAGVLGELPTGTDLLRSQSHPVSLEDLGAVFIGNVGNAQLQFYGTVDVDEVLVDCKKKKEKIMYPKDLRYEIAYTINTDIIL